MINAFRLGISCTLGTRHIKVLHGILLLLRETETIFLVHLLTRRHKLTQNPLHVIKWSQTFNVIPRNHVVHL